MEKGVSKYWTPGKELEYQERLKGCRTFAERHLILSVRDLIKYDGRSRAAKRAGAQARLRIAAATEKDLEELAELGTSTQPEIPGEIPGLARASFEAQRLRELEEAQAEIKKKGVNKEELRCR